MKKRLISFVLTLTFLFCLNSPALAAVPREGRVIAEYTLKEELAYADTEILDAEAEFYLDFSNQLTPAAMTIYNALVEHAAETIHGNTEIDITFPPDLTKDYLSFADYVDAVSAFTRQHSEIFWIDFSKVVFQVRDNGANKPITAKLFTGNDNYYISPYKKESEVQSDRLALAYGIERAYEAIDKTASQYDQLLQLHDYICANAKYNSNILSEDMRMFEAVSALDADPNTDPVCEGYARAFKLVADKLGTPCILITGYGIVKNTAVSHMWNYVYLDGAWYAIDVTWDDELSSSDSPRHDYFLTGSNGYCNSMTFRQSHVPSGMINNGGRVFYYPALSDNPYLSEKPESANQKLIKDSFLTAERLYSDGLFSDVKKNDWFRDNVAQAYILGLMVGNGNGEFNVNGNITYAEALSIAARIHSTYNDLSIPSSDGGSWYDGAVRYALENGIITEEYENYNTPITRREFALILSCSLPAEVLPAMNEIADGHIPDVSDSEEIYMLYRAGILRGDTDGSFYPETSIRRCEVAAIVTRMVDINLRVPFTL